MTNATLLQPDLSDLRVIDADTHLTEPHDLWTSRAPAAYRDRVPQVRDVDGVPTWTVDGATLQRAAASSVVHRDGTRCRGTAFIEWSFDDAHLAAYDVPTRLRADGRDRRLGPDRLPERSGLRRSEVRNLQDPTLKNLCATLYNDAMAELQEQGKGRLFPMALLPWWDIDASVAEAERAAMMGLRGVNMTSDPQQGGAPDLGQPRVGSAVGGLRRPRAAGELPHRRQRDEPVVVRHRRRGRRTATTRSWRSARR